eukprot:6186587-Pleurochrysis_carterae.AAC.7
MTARSTVRFFGAGPFSVGGHLGVSGDIKTSQKHTSAKQNAKTRKQERNAKPNKRFRNNSVVNCEYAAVLRSSRPRSPPRVLASRYQAPRLFWQIG